MLRVLLGAILLCIGTAPTWAASIGFDSTAGTPFAVGQPFTLTLEGNGFTQPLDGGGVNLQFDPGVLQLESVTVDTAVWDFAPANGTIDNGSGVVSDILFNAFFNPSPLGNFDIATVQFLAVGAGSSSLLLSPSASNPFSTGGVILNPGADFTFDSASIVVTPVPLPGSLGLLGSAVLALAVAGVGRRLAAGP
jgi:hypothetical protein